MTEDFAEYHAAYFIRDGKYTASRRLVIKKSEVPVDSWDAYKKFSKMVADDHDRYINLKTGAAEYPEGEGPKATSSAGGSKTFEQLAGEARQVNPEAARLLGEAVQAMDHHDLTRAEEALNRVRDIDPKFITLHAMLGALYGERGDRYKAISEFNKELEYHPEDIIAYEGLIEMQQQMGHKAEVLATMRKWHAAAPGNLDVALRLAKMLSQEKKYPEAVQLLEEALKTSPDSSAVKSELAFAYLNNLQTEQGLKLLKTSTAGNRDSYNTAARILADANLDLDTASEYADKALAGANDQTLKAENDDDGYAATNTLAGVWDTRGWVYFRQGNKDAALTFLRAAWLLSQNPESGYHLGQLYEKLGRKTDAAHTYKLALVSPSATQDEIKKRYETLTGQKVTDTDAVTLRRSGNGSASPGEELSKMRSVDIPSGGTTSGSAIFTIVFSPGKVDSVRFQSGDDSLKSWSPKIQAAGFNAEFPDKTPARLYRRGMLVCSKYTGCNVVLLIPDSVHLVEDLTPSD